jgi:DUF4097 and DUF4098 domain-containing protein YvlB
VTALQAAPAAAQRSEDFNWKGTLQAGRTLEIKGVNGDINAVYTGGSEVRVVAEKTSKKSNVGDVRIEVVPTANGVTICAVYPTPVRNRITRRANECTPGEHWNVSTDNNDVSVEWTIEVPRGVRLFASTVNGDVDIQKLQSDVTAETVNGSIDLSTSGLAQAKTVNGSLEIAMGRTNWTRELRLSTVNGGIAVTFPSDLNTRVSASTVNGDIETDWPLTVRGRFGQRNLNGTIGSGGGRSLALSTVNGDIEIRKH